MADVSKLKARRTLGTPPSLAEASRNLDRPEISGEPRDLIGGIPVRLRQPTGEPRIDGRSMRRTNRTVQFATRVTPEFDRRVRAIALEEGLLIVEVLERALQAYENQQLSSR